MKNVILFFALYFVYLGVNGQKSSISFLPEKPTSGQNIHVFYNSTGTPLDTCKNIKALVYFVRPENNIYAVEMDFDYENNTQMLTLKPENDVVGVVIIPTNESFNIQDTNENLAYHTLLYDKKGLPLNGGYADLGIAYCRLVNSNKLNNSALSIARGLFEREFEKKPSLKRNWYAKFYFNTLNNDTKSRQLLESELGLFSNVENLNEDEIKTLIENYRKLKNINKSNYFSDLQRINFPNDNYSIQNKVMEVQVEFNKVQKFEEKQAIYEKLIKDYAYLTNELAIRYVKATQVIFLMRLYKDYFERNRWREWYQLLLDINIEETTASISNIVASNFCNQGTYLDIAEKLIINSINIAENDLLKINNNSFQSFLTKREIVQSKEEKLANYLCTYGSILGKKNKCEEARLLLKKSAIDYGKRQLVACNEAYIFSLLELGMKAEAEQEIKIVMRTGKASEKINKMLREIYPNDIETVKSQESKYWESTVKKQMIKQVSPNFSLRNRKNEIVDLEELKGKIVVIDFWATWCGPCVASFGSYYEIMNKYKNDSALAFIFVDTKEKDLKYKQKVEEIMKNKGQDFNVLFDDKDEVAHSFGVVNLPTKFIIDKEGNLRFKDVGFDINKSDEFVKKLNWVIELLKEESFQK